MDAMQKVKSLMILKLSILTSNDAGDYNPDVETNIFHLPLRCEDPFLLEYLIMMPIMLIYHEC